MSSSSVFGSSSSSVSASSESLLDLEVIIGDAEQELIVVEGVRVSFRAHKGYNAVLVF